MKKLLIVLMIITLILIAGCSPTVHTQKRETSSFIKECKTCNNADDCFGYCYNECISVGYEGVDNAIGSEESKYLGLATDVSCNCICYNTYWEWFFIFLLV